jgi:hypothetical protein
VLRLGWRVREECCDKMDWIKWNEMFDLFAYPKEVNRDQEIISKSK